MIGSPDGDQNMSLLGDTSYPNYNTFATYTQKESTYIMFICATALSSDTRNVSFRRKPYPKYIKAVDVCR
jgi:hypothetical protein